VCSLFATLATQDTHNGITSSFLLLVRGVGGLLISSVVLWHRCPCEQNFPPGKRENLGLCLLRGLGGALAQGFSLYAFTKWNLGDVASIMNLAPVWAALFGIIFLSQQCKISIWISLCGAFGGMLLITRPQFIFGTEDNFPPLPFSMAVLSGVASGTTDLLIQRLGEDQWVLTWYAGVGQILLAAICWPSLQPEIPVWNTLTPLVWSSFVLIPVTGTANQVFRTAALQMTKDVRVLIMRFFVIVFCCIWDMLPPLNRTLHLVSGLGVALILVTGIYMVFEKKFDLTDGELCQRHCECGS